MIQSLRAYPTLRTHPRGRGWCLYIQSDNILEVKWYWFEDLESMCAFILSYPEGVCCCCNALLAQEGSGGRCPHCNRDQCLRCSGVYPCPDCRRSHG